MKFGCIVTVLIGYTSIALAEAIPEFWYRADERPTPSLWLDSSPNERHAILSGKSKPIWVAANVDNFFNFHNKYQLFGGENTNRGVEADGSYFQIPKFSLLKAGFCLYTVLRPTEAISNSRFFALSSFNQTAKHRFAIGRFARNNSFRIESLSRSKVLEQTSSGYYPVNKTLQITVCQTETLRIKLWVNGEFVLEKAGFGLSELQFTTNFIGRNLNAVYGLFQGYIATMMMLGDQQNREAIESYLALKYGITRGSRPKPVHYTTIDGKIIWDANIKYQNNIIGLGNFTSNLTPLDQSIAKTDDGFIMATTNDFYNANSDQDRIKLAKNEFLIVGDNRIRLDKLIANRGTLPDEILSYTPRTWRVISQTKSKIYIYIKDLPNIEKNQRYFLVQSRDESFTDVTMTQVSRENTFEVVFHQTEKPQFFKIGVGFAKGVALWLRADIGVEDKYWVDSSDNKFRGTLVGVNPPYKVSGSAANYFNFNPKVKFGSQLIGNTNKSTSFLELPRVEFPYYKNGMQFYVVLQRDQQRKDSLIWEFSDSSGKNKWQLGSLSHTGSYQLRFKRDDKYYKLTSLNNLIVSKQTQIISGNWTLPDYIAHFEINGVLQDKKQVPPLPTGSFTKNSIGTSSDDSEGQFVDMIAEFILMNLVPSAKEHAAMLNYLGFKYGINTLNSSSSSAQLAKLGSKKHFYSDGTLLWTGNDTYKHLIALGRGDNKFPLDQRVSTSQNSNILLSTTNDFVSSNTSSSRKQMSQNSFLVIGETKGDINKMQSSNKPDFAIRASSKIWRLEQRNAVEKIFIAFNQLPQLKQGEKFALVYSETINFIDSFALATSSDNVFKLQFPTDNKIGYFTIAVVPIYFKIGGAYNNK